MLTWLADVLRAGGLKVREVPAWTTRGHGDMGEVLGCLLHHTAGPATGSYPSEQVVVYGRTDLAGPLANLGLARDGTWIVIAAGSAWHAGTGSAPWCPTDQGNTHLIGIEAESTGSTTPNGDWTPEQREAYPRGVAALLKHLGLPASRAIGHKEWAPSRKIDPAFWDMNTFRADVQRWMTSPTPTPSASEDVMAVIPLPVADGVFRTTCMAEAGASSSVVAKAWITYGSTWGGAHFKVCALDAKGVVMPGLHDVDVPNNGRRVFEVPSGAVMVTLEGRAGGAVPAAALVCQPK